MKKEIEFDEDIYISAKTILQEEGISVSNAINMFLKKVVKENTIGFLFNKPESDRQHIDQDNLEASFSQNRMTKSLAKRLFYNKGFTISDKYVFASENNSTHIFWANIHYRVLSQKWSLVLNDKSKKIIRLFEIPSNEFRQQDFVMRADKPEIIDLQIGYNDPTFTDNRSQISFKRFLVDSIKY